MEKIQLQETMSQKQGLRIPKKFTAAGQSPFDMFTYEKRSSIIRNPDGSIVFEMHDVEVPNFWSQVATDILAQKYFRKRNLFTAPFYSPRMHGLCLASAAPH